MRPLIIKFPAASCYTSLVAISTLLSDILNLCSPFKWTEQTADKTYLPLRLKLSYNVTFVYFSTN